MKRKLPLAVLLLVLNIASIVVYLRYIQPFPKGQGFQYVAHPVFMLGGAFLTSLIYFILIRNSLKKAFFYFLVFFMINAIFLIFIRML